MSEAIKQRIKELTPAERAEIARKLKVNERTIRRWVNGKIKPVPLAALEKMLGHK